MRSALALTLTLVMTGCTLEAEDPPPTARPCAEPAQATETLKDGPYGSAVTSVTNEDVYPSFRSPYPKRMVFNRATSSLRIEYFHGTHAVVESYSVGPLSAPELRCDLVGQETGKLVIADVTVDGAPGDLSRYDDWIVGVRAGATITYSGPSEAYAVSYSHGFSPIYSAQCPVHRPTEGAACDDASICLYDDVAEHCTARCAGAGWTSSACE